MSDHVNEVSDSSFEKDVLQSDKPVLVDFCRLVCALPDVGAHGRRGGGKICSFRGRR